MVWWISAVKTNENWWSCRCYRETDHGHKWIWEGQPLVPINYKNKYKLSDDVPIELRNYFTDTAKLPDWADKDLINLGQQIYIRHGIWISLLLSYKSLPECYACAKGAEVLHMTARLNERHGSKDTFHVGSLKQPSLFYFAWSRVDWMRMEGSRSCSKVEINSRGNSLLYPQK